MLTCIIMSNERSGTYRAVFVSPNSQETEYVFTVDVNQTIRQVLLFIDLEGIVLKWMLLSFSVIFYLSPASD